MPPEPAEKHPPKGQPETRVADPRDLTYQGGFTGDQREIVENPAVTPEMVNEPGDVRIDLLEED